MGLLDDVAVAVGPRPVGEDDVGLVAADVLVVGVDAVEEPLRTRTNWTWIWTTICWEIARQAAPSWTMTWTST